MPDSSGDHAASDGPVLRVADLQGNPSALFGRPIDLAFLDGYHLFEFLLRDFSNTERVCRRNSVILLHDCVPTDVYITERREDDLATRQLAPHPEWWTGDVWKVVPILRKYRPDLKLHTFDAHPTGLVAITNLASGCRILERAYFDILEEFRDITLRDFGIEQYVGSLQLISTSAVETPEDIYRYFWL